MCMALKVGETTTSAKSRGHDVISTRTGFGRKSVTGISVWQRRQRDAPEDVRTVAYRGSPAPGGAPPRLVNPASAPGKKSTSKKKKGKLLGKSGALQ